MCAIRRKSNFFSVHGMLLTSAIASIKNPIPNTEKITFPNLLHNSYLNHHEGFILFFNIPISDLNAYSAHPVI
jgi:hypothetical protein